MLKTYRLMAALALCVAALPAARAAEPKIAVTDLAYEERVREYFRVVSASSRSSVNASASVQDGPRSYSERGRVSARSEAATTRKRARTRTSSTASCASTPRT